MHSSFEEKTLRKAFTIDSQVTSPNNAPLCMRLSSERSAFQSKRKNYLEIIRRSFPELTEIYNMVKENTSN